MQKCYVMASIIMGKTTDLTVVKRTDIDRVSHKRYTLKNLVIHLEL